VLEEWNDLWDHQVVVWAMDYHMLEWLSHWKMDQPGWFTKVRLGSNSFSECMFSPANILIVIIIGNDYSQGSSGCQAVVTDDRYMSSAWRVVDRATCSQRHRLGSYVEEAGCQYNLFFDNCWNAASRMMNLCRRRPSSGGWWWSGR